MPKNRLNQVAKITILTIIASFFILFNNARAQADEKEVLQTKQYFINLDKATIARGYTVAAYENQIKLSLIPGILNESTGVDVWELHEPLNEPWQFNRISEVYQFEFRNKAAYDNEKPFIIQLKYNSEDNNLKQVYYFDKNYNSWRPLPTQDYFGEQMARAYIHLPFARVAVFSNPDVMAVGNASWYVYKNGDFAASPDFPKGSILKVTNLENNKTIEVEINDWGPDRAIHPDRVIDLDKLAFKKIASLGDGIVRVGVEPIYIPEENGSVLGIKIDRINENLDINSKAFIVQDINSGEVIIAGNATTTLPLASLTKIVTASVFLDTNPDFNKVITYSVKDEENNWPYLENKYESMRLQIEDGDQFTVKDAFFSTLVKSTNNTAETLARISGIPREDFIKKMNEKVHEWGATSTVFVEPSGLSPENVSTVSDYAIISKNALKHPKLLEATTLKRYEFTTLKDKKKVIQSNTNELLYDSFYVTGGKTGYIDEVGYCLMTKIKTGNSEIIGVLLGADTREQSFNEMRDLLKYASRKK
ncbi:MAG: RlpA-like double-psi beta-barrel domain-containing protein [Patescibacteria group bacterium]|jgi:rare lipoprotein A